MIKNITIKNIIFTISIVLIICIVFLVKNIVVYGKGKSFGSVKLVTEYDDNTTIDEMETVTFGSYPQLDASGSKKKPIEWIVLDRKGNRALLLSKYILDCKCYNKEYKDITWETCYLRRWLNNDFYYQAFDSNEQNKIKTTNVINNNNIDYGTNGGNNTKDKIFCLSIEEIRRYFGNGIKEGYGYQLGKKVATKGTVYAMSVDNNGYNLYVYGGSGESEYNWAIGNSTFWLRSPGNDLNASAFVLFIGHLDMAGFIVDSPRLGVRPALWVSY